ncbi:MAG: cation transporter [Flavobacteriaceae bacterium]|nr:cation transporter [Flavobacteriaceae bacterium]
MKKVTKLVTLLCVILLLASCEKKDEEKSDEAKVTEKKELSATTDLKKVALNIEGMTCEIGCARTIQSKLSKIEGIKFAEVNFEKKKGIVEYDANKVSEKEIVAVVEKIAGGDLYKVSDIKTTE